MLVNIVPIGNSKGLRLSKSLIEKYQLRDRVEIIEQEDGIIIRPYRSPRAGWAEAFKKMHENGDDKLLIPDLFEDEEFE